VTALTFGNFLHAFAPIHIVSRSPHHHDPTMQITNHHGHAALRRGRYSEPGRNYLITSTTAQRQPLFDDPDIARVAARTLHEQRLWRNSELLAWVLMPDHVHLLVRLGDDESLSRLVARVKTIVARQARQVRATGLPFWSASFHDHALRHDEDLLAVARYIIANPVRAGLVRSALDWPFWDCAWLPHAASDLIEAP